MNVASTLQEISNTIDVIENCPKPNVFFRDISPILLNPTLFTKTIELIIKLIEKKNIVFDKMGFIDSRGYLFAGSLFSHFKKPIILFRKPKLTEEKVYCREYGTEYSKDKLTVRKDAILEGERILIIDDLLATGGSFGACIELVEKDARGVVAGCFALVDLHDVLPKNELLSSKTVFCLFSNSSATPDKTILNHDVLQVTDATLYMPFTNLSETDERIVVFYHPSMESIAHSLTRYCNVFRLGAIKWNKFPDGYFDIQFEENLFNKKIVYITSLFRPEDFLEMKTMMAVFARQGCLSCDYYIPYYGPSTMERVPQEGIVATAETTGHAIGAGMPFTQSGCVRVHIFDIHATVERFYFGDFVQVRMDTMVHEIKKLFPKNTTIVFPDDGAKKRFQPFFNTYPIIVCQKSRLGNDRKITICETIGFPSPEYEDNYNKCFANLVIFDDLGQTGGTIIETAKALRKMYGQHIVTLSASVVHAVFPNDAHNRILNAPIDKFYVTNTNPMVTKKLEKFSKFIVVPIENVMANDLAKIHQIASIGQPANPTKILVASDSEIKLQAVKAKFHENHYQIYSINVPSSVPPQPINEQTKQGCENRFAELVKFNEMNGNEFDILVSIENGIDTATGCEDFCVVKVGYKNRSFCLESSVRTSFPKIYLNKSLEQNQQITVGEIMEQMHGISHPKNDWHKNYKSFWGCIEQTLSRGEIILGTLKGACMKLNI